MSDQQTKPGPLHLGIGPPRTTEAALAMQKLRGHSTAADWLPAGVWPELDDVRAEQLRVRDLVAGELASLEASVARFRQEDQQFDRELRQAQREGRPESVEDQRTPPEQRQAERKAIEERLWAGVVVLGEIAEGVIELVREHEDNFLASLRARLEPAQEKRREAERLLTEAKAEEWHLHQLGNWVQKTSEDGPLGRQPAPTPTVPPSQFSAEVARSMLEVPWHRERPWKGEGEKPVRPWIEVEADQAAASANPDLEDESVNEPDEALPAGDPTGVVLGLDETAGARSRGAA